MRFFLTCCLVILGNNICGETVRGQIEFESVVKLAREKAYEPFSANMPKVSKVLKDLTYDDYQRIRFKEDNALWHDSDSSFRIDFFHLGYLFNEPVQIFEYSDTHYQEIPYVNDFFDLPQKLRGKTLGNVPGYSGLKIRTPLKTPEFFDEVLVFQGASYFRALGKTSRYGLSARGLAVGTGSEHEEFPSFTRFWVHKPRENESILKIFALLESPSVAGAYAFDLLPGEPTEITVRVCLFRRVGSRDDIFIAPLTSMFWFGENNVSQVSDWRPEVHDSDALLIHADKEWIFQPLSNPPGTVTTDHVVQQLSGFGLLQRDRNFDHYQDLGSRYELRPTAWITPLEPWPEGSVVLYEFNQVKETVDNVVAYFKPLRPPAEREEFHYAYKLSFGSLEPNTQTARVLSTRFGKAQCNPDATSVIIEYSTPKGFNPATLRQYDPFFSCDGELVEVCFGPQLIYNEVTGGLRIHIDIKSKVEGTKRLSAGIIKEGNVISERWVYNWN